MKRKNLEIKNISNKIEINNISNNFFSNKINRENTMKKFNNPVQIFRIEEREFNTLESANEYLLKEILKEGYEAIIENKEVFREALKKTPFRRREE